MRTVPRPPLVTVCCTFNCGALDLVANAVAQCLDAGGVVLSPVDPTPAEIIDGFWYVESDRYRDPVLVERRHLEAMAASDLIWLIAPDGYVGFSVGTEIAYAAGRGVPVYTADTIAEPAIAALARRAMTITEAMQRAHGTPHKTQAAQSMLFDPESASHHAQEALGALRELLLYPKRGQLFTAALASTVRSAVSGL